MKKEWFFIVNSTAGNGKSGKKINRIIEVLNRKNILYNIELTKKRNHAIEIAKNAADNGFEKIISVGGDGTLHEIVNGLMLSKNVHQVKLGIMPEGGGNDYAKNFQIPDNIEQCIDIYRKNITRKIDVGKAGTSYFINSFGLGFDAKVAYFAQKIKILNGLPRYLLAVLKAMIDLEHYPMSIAINGKMIERNVLFISINNGKFSGGGFQITPNAMVDDGQFDVCIVKALSRKEILRYLPLAIQGKHTHLPIVEMFKSSKVEIVSSAVSYYYDGEIPNPETIEKIELTMYSKHLSLLVP